MRYREWLCALAFVFLMTGEAVAQTGSPNPVTAHYRAYREALAAGNAVAAESAASAALEASIARDGDGGNTAVLAINLAQARLTLGRRGAAYEPALRAFNIASAGSSNVDPLMARLVLGRTELTAEHEAQGRERLERAIPEGRARPDMHTETYAAAVDLGRWFFSRELYVGALDAWTTAGDLAADAQGDTTYALAEAHLGAAAARMSRAMDAVMHEQSRPTDTRFNTNAFGPFREADEGLAEAQALLAPYAHTSAPDGGLTLGQRMYANTLAWRTAGRAFLQSRGQRPLPAYEQNVMVRADGRPFCPMNLIAEERPNFPPGANTAFAVGAAVVRFNVNDQGQTTSVDVAAAIPDRWFREALEQVTPQWRVERASDAPSNCIYQPIMYQTWMFYFR